MNILFFTNGKVIGTKGGTERATISIARALTCNYGHRCFSMFEIDVPEPMENCFIEEFILPTHTNGLIDHEAFANIINEYEIEVIIIQGSFIHVRLFRDIIGNKCHIILAHHFQPSWEKNFYTSKRLWHEIVKHGQPLRIRLKNCIYLAGFAYFKHRDTKLLQHAYKDAYEIADKVVLLCSGFIPAYKKFANLDSTANENFKIIPNMLSLSEFLDEKDIKSKKKNVLIVSRLEESCKQISIALKIWQLIKNRKESNGWQLIIIGEGPDRKLYERQIKQNNIPNVHLLGCRNPIEYYRNASILMMTSKSESWGLVLTEAQQMGCVPIAFNAYSSLTEIIQDGINGIIINNNDINAYVNSLCTIMSDEQYRQSIAKTSLRSCRKFAPNNIIKQWDQLLNEICK